MKRREFIATTAATALSAAAFCRAGAGAAAENEACGLTYPSPSEAMQAPRETLAYVPAIRVGTRHEGPDYLATVDVDPDSKTYARVIHRLPMPHVGDELHHYGWNACSSCHEGPHARRYLVVPGLRSGRIHIVDTAEQNQPKLHHVIEPEEIARKTNLSAPHTVHCRADGSIMISMLGDAEGRAPGGFLLLDQDFRIVGRWESDVEGMDYNYDFWYQVRHDTMVSSEWAAPRTFVGGFDLEDVQAGKYGRRLLFWDWTRKRVRQSVDLGEEGLIPLEIRFPDGDSTSDIWV